MIISKMYDVEIKSSNYNPDANTPIYIKATATDYNGNPVVGEDLIIKHNGIAVGNAITTNANGEASIATTCGSGGTHQFTCKSADCIIRVNPYPIGSIYMNVDDVDPSTLFGGTWTKLENRFLLAKGSTYTTLEATGGEATVTLKESEMPRHTHIQNAHSHQQYGNWSTGSGSSAGHMNITNRSVTKRNTGNSNPNPATNNVSGGGGAHNNMPPYMVVNIWKRIA